LPVELPAFDPTREALVTMRPERGAGTSANAEQLHVEPLAVTGLGLGRSDRPRDER